MAAGATSPRAEAPAPAEEKVAIPTFFGPEAARLFGWFHLPGANRRDLGVVLCKPFGHDAMCAHRALRELAEQLCAAGFPVLRYDHFGAGDSAGDAASPGLPQQWLDGVQLASGALRAASGCAKIALFGLRLGATLAAAAASRAPVEALVLWSPFRSGKLFVREAKAFQDLQGLTPRGEDGSIELAGFPLLPATIEGLGAIDLAALREKPAQRALLLGRDDIPEGTRLDEQLRALGVQVERSAAPGYAAMMRDANESRVPGEAIAAITGWLEPLAAEGSLRPAPRPAPEPLELAFAGSAVREEPLRFGPDSRLFGILSTPSPLGARAGGAAQPGRPAVLFLNVGSNHHVGPNRMYVEQSRALASRGITCLRFDVAGLGDSPPRAGKLANLLYSPESVLDTRAALDLLGERLGIQRAALIGLCSGAYLAYHTTPEDPRVAGQALLNQQTYSWREGDSLALAIKRSVKSSRFYRSKIRDLETWKRLVRGEIELQIIAGAFVRRFGDRLAAQRKSLASFLRGRGWEDSPVAANLRSVLKRGSRVLLVFSDTDGGIDVMEQHLGADARKIARHPNFRLEIVEGADHTFTPRQSQLKLAAVLADWLEDLA